MSLSPLEASKVRAQSQKYCICCSLGTGPTMCQSFRSLFICLITWLYPDCLLHHLNFHFINAGEKKNPSRICSRSPHALLAHIPSTDGASVSLNRKSWYLRLISPGWVFDFPSTVFCPNLFSYRVLRYSQLFLSLNSLDFAKWQFLPLPRPPPPIPSFLKADELIRSKSFCCFVRNLLK